MGFTTLCPDRQLVWTVFASDGSQVLLAVSLVALAKNELEGHHLDHILVPLWRVGGDSHPLCPVATLQSHIQMMQWVPTASLFVWLNS